MSDPRYWTHEGLDATPANHPGPLVPLVDEQAGGVVGYLSEPEAGRIVAALEAAHRAGVERARSVVERDRETAGDQYRDGLGLARAYRQTATGLDDVRRRLAEHTEKAAYGREQHKRNPGAAWRGFRAFHLAIVRDLRAHLR